MRLFYLRLFLRSSVSVLAALPKGNGSRALRRSSFDVRRNFFYEYSNAWYISDMSNCKTVTIIILHLSNPVYTNLKNGTKMSASQSSIRIFGTDSQMAGAVLQVSAWSKYSENIALRAARRKRCARTSVVAPSSGPNTTMTSAGLPLSNIATRRSMTVDSNLGRGFVVIGHDLPWRNVFSEPSLLAIYPEKLNRRFHLYMYFLRHWHRKFYCAVAFGKTKRKLLKR